MIPTPSRMHVASDRPPGNPFATRFTRPGALEPLDSQGRPLDLEALTVRLRRARMAAITGPHGHGKTTLLVALAARLEAEGLPVTVVRVRSRRDWAAVWRAISGLPRGGVACIDGWDSLAALRGPLRLAALLLGRTLLVTSHRPGLCPVLWRCETSRGLLEAIVARLPDRHGRIGGADIAEAFLRHDGDLRESLAHLYDRFEQRRWPTARPVA